MHAHQDPWRLLLLRQRASGQPATARVKLRQHGTRHDRRNQVRTTPTTMKATSTSDSNKHCLKLSSQGLAS